jgi:hypothetical protein
MSNASLLARLLLLLLLLLLLRFLLLLSPARTYTSVLVPALSHPHVLVFISLLFSPWLQRGTSEICILELPLQEEEEEDLYIED